MFSIPAVRQNLLNSEIKADIYNLFMDKKLKNEHSQEFDAFAYSFASEHGYVKDIVDLHEKYKYDPTKNQNLAFRVASRNGHLDCIKYLQTYLSLPLPKTFHLHVYESWSFLYKFGCK